MRYSSLLIILCLLPWHAGAAPLNKYGSMPQQNMPVPIQQQQTLLPRQEQQQTRRFKTTTKRNKKNSQVMFKIKRLLIKLPLKKVRLWQKKFEQKRDHALRQGKKSVVDYYQRLIDLCKKTLAQRSIQE